MWDWLATGFFGLIAVLWFALALRGLWCVLRLRRLPPEPADVGPPPRVSVVVAARDEASRLETTVRRLLGQQGVELELIVADDRSTDGTEAILCRLAAEDPRLRLVRIDTLPPGWLGKCHACHVGASAAAGDWLLFADGDVWLSPEVIARAVRAAEGEAADHVTLVPSVSRPTFFGTACQLLFQVGFARRAAAVNADRPGAYLGIGAFNLVRADAYRAAGGHEALRMEVADDLKLGLLLRQAGRRTRVFLGAGDVEADWCPSLPGMIQGLQKNHFAVADYRLGRIVVAVVLILLLWGAAVAGPLTGLLGGYAAGLGLLALVVPTAAAARRVGWSVLPALLTPLLILVVPVCLLNSTVVTLRQGGVRWRDTFYPLAELRAGNVRWMS